MSKRHAVLFLAALPIAAVAAPETFTLDPYHTFPNFTVDHLGLSTIHGRFDKTTGKVTLDRAAKSGSVDIVIPTATVTYRNVEKSIRAKSNGSSVVVELRMVGFQNDVFCGKVSKVGIR